MVTASITGSSFIFLAVLVIFVFAIAYGLYTRKGSGINPRPWDGSEGAAGAEGAEEIRGHEEGDKSALNAGTEQSPLHQHGTDSHASERDAEREREGADGESAE